MPDRHPRLTAKDAEKLLMENGFELTRQKGSHRIYRKDQHRMVIPHHKGKILHPKIIKELLEILESTSIT